MNINEAIDLFWDSVQRGVHDPQALRGQLSIDDAYRVQLGVLDRHVRAGEKHVGWKIGLTSKVLQTQVGFPEPVFGYLLESGRRPSGFAFDFASLTRPAFENELCMTLVAEMRGPLASVEQARAAIGAITPALEIVERRSGAPADLPLGLVDNAQQSAFVLGESVELRDRDLAQVPVIVHGNGRLLGKAMGAEVMGDPLAAIAWLANKLERYGRSLQAGQIVMSGSFTPQYDLDRGDEVHAEFQTVGAVRASAR